MGNRVPPGTSQARQSTRTGNTAMTSHTPNAGLVVVGEGVTVAGKGNADEKRSRNAKALLFEQNDVVE